MRAALLALAALLTPGTPAFAQEGKLAAGAGLHFSSGDYGTAADTEITALVFTARYETGPWRLRATVPYLEVSGGASVIPGVGSVGNANPRRRGGGAGTASASGLGDVVTSATYALYYDPATQLGLDATGKVKLPTADADAGLGTGETDVSLQLDAYKSFGRTTAFAGVGYTFFGSSARVPLDDALYYSLGATHRLDARDSAGLSYDERERISAGAGAQRELMAFFMRRFDRLWQGQLYLLKGLADGSPDWGAGASFLYSF